VTSDANDTRSFTHYGEVRSGEDAVYESWRTVPLDGDDAIYIGCMG
jgi:hypothetical protein